MIEKRWVYLGQAAGEKVAIIDRFQEIDDNDTKVGASFAFRKFKKTMVPGGIYNVGQEVEHQVAERLVIFSGKMINDSEWLNKIQSDHLIFQGQKKFKSLETKFKNEHKLTTDLSKLAATYRNLYGIERMIFEWMVLAKLRELAGKA